MCKIYKGDNFFIKHFTGRSSISINYLFQYLMRDNRNIANFFRQAKNFDCNSFKTLHKNEQLKYQQLHGDY